MSLAHNQLPVGGAVDPVLLRACAWCNRINLDDRWVHESEAISALRTFEHSAPPSFTHGVCPTCFARLAERRSAEDAKPGNPAAKRTVTTRPTAPLPAR